MAASNRSCCPPLPPPQNPAYKGKWSAPMIDNPAYKGVWKPRDIPNPDFHKDEAPLTNIGKVRQRPAAGVLCGRDPRLPCQTDAHSRAQHAGGWDVSEARRAGG